MFIDYVGTRSPSTPHKQQTMIFEFGMYNGKTLEEVAEETNLKGWDYLYYLVNSDDVTGKMTVEMQQEIKTFLDSNFARAVNEKTVGTYVMGFGRHKGQQLKDVPRSYIRWLAHGRKSAEKEFVTLISKLFLV